MAGGYALTVRFTLRDAEAAQRFDALVAKTAIGIRKEPGTLVYAVHTLEDEPLVRVFYELYADRDAFQAHEEQAHTKHFLLAREEFLVNIDVSFLDLSEETSKYPRLHEGSDDR